MTTEFKMPEQEPYAFSLFDFEGRHDLFLMENNEALYTKNKHVATLLYTSPQPREWQELSEENRRELFTQYSIPVEKWQIMKSRYITEPNFTRFYEAISAALRAKNGG